MGCQFKRLAFVTTPRGHEQYLEFVGRPWLDGHCHLLRGATTTRVKRSAVGGGHGEQERVSIVPSQLPDEHATAASHDRKPSAGPFYRVLGLSGSRACERFPAVHRCQNRLIVGMIQEWNDRRNPLRIVRERPLRGGVGLRAALGEKDEQ